MAIRAYTGVEDVTSRLGVVAIGRGRSYPCQTPAIKEAKLMFSSNSITSALSGLVFVVIVLSLSKWMMGSITEGILICLISPLFAFLLLLLVPDLSDDLERLKGSLSPHQPPKHIRRAPRTSRGASKPGD